MTDSYAPDATSPGARAAQAHSAFETREQRQAHAKRVMEGSRTVDDAPPYVPTASTSREAIDRQSIKDFAVGKLEDAKVDSALENAYDEWAAFGNAHGWLDEAGNVSDGADESWIAAGDGLGFFGDESGGAGDDVAAEWVAMGQSEGWVDAEGRVSDDADKRWLSIGQQAGYFEDGA